MLALIVALTLSQCTKDSDCKGDRICNRGECADMRPVEEGGQAFYFGKRPEETERSKSNPYKVHIWISMSGAIASWAITAAGSFAIGDILFGTTVIPVLGPLISYLRCTPANNCAFQSGGAVMLAISSALQLGFLAYLLAAIIRTVNYEP